MRQQRAEKTVIKAFPDINFRILGKKFADNPFFGKPNFFFFASGRAAIHLAAKSLGNSSSRVAYLPSFHCGVEVEAFLRAGYTVKFYGINEDLGIEFPEESELIENGSIFFIVHYFGFPQDLKRVVSYCRKHAMILMEDCAHGLYSRDQGELLGTRGDLGIFSPRKTLALPNGGGLLVNASHLSAPASPVGRRVFSLFKGALRSMCEFERERGGLAGKFCDGIIRAFNTLHKPPTHADNATVGGAADYYDDSRFDYDLAMSPLSRLLMEPMPEREIVARRRENYRLLAEKLSEHSWFKPVFSLLPEGVAPLCLPVWVDESDRWVGRLHAQAVEPFVFGRNPHPLMDKGLASRAEGLRSRILGLPVHQDLSREDIVALVNRLCLCESA